MNSILVLEHVYFFYEEATVGLQGSRDTSVHMYVCMYVHTYGVRITIVCVVHM